MIAARPTILLLAENRLATSGLTDFLERQGCACSIATLSSAPDLLRSCTFDFMISTVPLRQGDPVVLMLGGSDCRIFYRIAVEDGCWWVPLDGKGRKSLGSPALRCAEFAAFLENALNDFKAASERRKQEFPAYLVNASD